MKRLFAFLLALLMLPALAAPAYADIMWEPSENPFFTAHRNSCEYENRSYYANGKEGFITLWDAPDGSMVRAQYQNGEELWAGYTYNGEWALISFREAGNLRSGWAAMSELELIYDYIAFQEEYADKITAYSGEFADYGGDAAVVNFYAYPGAPEIRQAWDTAGEWHVLENLTGSADGHSYISSIFVDEDGRTWGYVGYMYGHLNSWFCLDEPDGTDFPVRDVSAPGLVPAQTPVLPVSAYVPYILVGLTVAVTAGILAIFYGKRRKKPTK